MLCCQAVKTICIDGQLNFFVCWNPTISGYQMVPCLLCRRQSCESETEWNGVLICFGGSSENISFEDPWQCPAATSACPGWGLIHLERTAVASRMPAVCKL